MNVPVSARRPRRRARWPSPTRRPRTPPRARRNAPDAPSTTVPPACRSCDRRLAFDTAVTHRQDARAALGERRVVGDDHEGGAVGIDAIEERGNLLAGCPIEL